MSKSWHVILLMILSFLIPAESAVRPDEVLTREYEVYVAYLQSGCNDAACKDAHFVIEERTAPDKHNTIGEQMQWLRGKCPTVPHDLTSAFERVASVESNLVSTSFSGINVHVLSDADLKQFFQGDIDKGWEAFDRAYPRAAGIFSFSRVAFDQTGNWALMYVAHACGGECGAGINVVLQRDRKGWHEVCSADLWIS